MYVCRQDDLFIMSLYKQGYLYIFMLFIAEMVPKEVTVALLKPDVVKEGKTEEVLAKVHT